MPAEPPPGSIRGYTPRDEKQVRFIIGQAQMESLAYANNKGEDDDKLPPFTVSFDSLFFQRTSIRSLSPYGFAFRPCSLSTWIGGQIRHTES